MLLIMGLLLTVFSSWYDLLYVSMGVFVWLGSFGIVGLDLVFYGDGL